MKKKRNLNQGPSAFDEWYEHEFGDRWQLLRASLEKEVVHYSYNENLVKPYYLDFGSVVAANSLPLPADGRILDLCAAPGGKSLVIASRMGSNVSLVSNEFSRDRRNRLLSVLDEHLSPEVRSRLTVTGHDASRWSRYEKESADSILLDAPCSSERHVLNSPVHLEQWTSARIKNLSIRQWALLSSAWLVLKPGGHLLYATCALSRAENDGVVEKLFRKYADAERQIIDFEPYGELSSAVDATEYGYHILPDACNGAGPLYFSLIRKKF